MIMILYCAKTVFFYRFWQGIEFILCQNCVFFIDFGRVSSAKKEGAPRWMRPFKTELGLTQSVINKNSNATYLG